MTYVDKCWIWPGGKNETGYGRLKINGKLKRAHRVIYEISKGEIPQDFEVLHSCDNPSCVNPNHLRTGTHAENMKEAAERFRLASGLDHYKGKLSKNQVEEIRLLYASGQSQKEIAEKFDLHQSYVSRLVNGSRR